MYIRGIQDSALFGSAPLISDPGLMVVQHGEGKLEGNINLFKRWIHILSGCVCRRMFACMFALLSVIQFLSPRPCQTFSAGLSHPYLRSLFLLSLLPLPNIFNKQCLSACATFVWICLSELLRVKTGNQSGKKNTAQGTRDSLMKNLPIILIRKDLSFNVKSNGGESTMNNCSSMYYYCISRLQQIVENTEDATHRWPFR